MIKNPINILYGLYVYNLNICFMQMQLQDSLPSSKW